MAKFIEHNNQTLLWNTITKLPLFHEKIDPDFQAQWFRDMIEKIYINQQHRILNNNELLTLNKHTISCMITSLKKITLAENELNGPYDTQQSYMNMMPPTNRNQQNDSNVITNGNVNQNVVFEVVEDKAIENMDELVSQQMKMRELDLNPNPAPKKKVSFQNAEVINTIDNVEVIDTNHNEEKNHDEEKIRTLESTIKTLQHENEILLKKLTIYESNDIQETLNDIIDYIGRRNNTDNNIVV